MNINETSAVQVPTKRDNLLYIQFLLKCVLAETETRIGMSEGFPISVHIAAAYDEANKMLAEAL